MFLARYFWIAFILFVFIAGCSGEERIIEDVGGEMKLTSNDFKNNGNIPSMFTCDGEDISPHLAWEDAPESTKSFALVVDDPDAPMKTWAHWLVYDMPKEAREIKQNSIPGKQLINDFGKEDYGGPCPPSGTHRYVFTIYALDAAHLDGVSKANFRQKIEERKIDSARLIGLYKRQ